MGDIIVKQVQDGEWIHRTNPLTGKPLRFQELICDPDTGMFVRYYCYHAGTVTPLHTHPCSHGMFVLSGTLVTNKGSFGPGSFVWFEEGCEATHGASDEEDLIALFITNKPFDIHYVDQEHDNA